MKARRLEAAALVAEIESHGGKVLETGSGGKHGYVLFVHKGKRHKLPFAVTPSCHRADLNSLARVRQVMGVKRKIAKSERRGRKQDNCKQERVKCPKLTIKPDPWAALKGEAMKERDDG